MWGWGFDVEPSLWACRNTGEYFVISTHVIISTYS